MIYVGTKLEDVHSLEIVASTMFATRLIENWYMVFRQNDEQHPYGVAVFLDGVCGNVRPFADPKEAIAFMLSLQRLAQVLG